jgi:ABC-type transport system substrate-binding protein
MIYRKDTRLHRRCGITLLLMLAALSLGVVASLGAPPKSASEMVIAWHVTIAPAWFNPSTAPPQITPFGLLYALHDALVRPLPGQKMGNSLAESWTESPDGLVYEFRLRQGLKFHNGKRAALLHRIQQLTMERVMFGPIMDLRALMGVGLRVTEHTINSLPMHPFPSLEDMRLKQP